MGTANPRIFAICKRCGFEREHYTRKRGTQKVSPCVMCSRETAATRAAAKADDPVWRERRRQQYERYNRSPKGLARSNRAQQADTPEPGAESLDEITDRG